MADKSINDLPQAQSLLDNGLLVIYQGGETLKILGSALKQYVDADIVSATAQALSPGSTPTANYNASTHVLTLGIPPGANATITATHYAASTSGTVTPTSWQTSIPQVSGGQYLWTRMTWSNGQYSYIVARQGVDGTGAVTSFNGRSGAVIPQSGDYTASQVTKAENTDNKVTSVSSSSTDDQYPSAKCVYDLIGDVDTVIDQINALIGG